MKKRFALLALATAGTACQQQAPPRQTDVKSAGAAVVTKKTTDTALTAIAHSPDTPGKTVSVDSFTAVVLTPYNLNSLFQSTYGGDATTQPMNGFFGSDLRRIEVVLTQVKRDPHQPARYLVEGKDRCRGIITSLAGWITVTRVAVLTDTATDTENKKVLLKSYAISGLYELREDTAAHGAGIFRGQLAVDMMLYDGKPIAESQSDSLSRGGMTTFDGNWTNLATGQRKDAIWVTSLYGYRGVQMVNDFFIGEREASINPKYAR